MVQVGPIFPWVQAKWNPSANVLGRTPLRSLMTISMHLLLEYIII